MKQFIQHLLIAIFLVAGFSIRAQSLQDPLPQDENVITGTLENGLKYYIRQNHKPEKRVEFRLVVNAGSVLEDDNQRGLAHFDEHMAFNGTKHFDKNDLVNFLEKTGVDFGADLNAYTSFDETVYMLQMPSDRQGLIDSAFMVLEDWAHNVTYDDEEIEKERGVIHEEWRLGLGAQDRMMKKYLPVLLKDSRYAERLPIGQMSVIDSCDPGLLRQFYRDWYRPDLMAVVVVGDIDPAYAESQIKKHFSGIKGPKQPRERVFYDIPDNTAPLVAIATDKEATFTMVSLMYKKDKLPLETMENFRNHLKARLYTGMLNARLYEIGQTPEAPFLYAGSGYGPFLARSKDAFSMYAMVKENRVTDAMSTLIEENRRVKQYGFTESELERQKAELLSEMENAFQEKDKTESRRFVSEYVNHYLRGNAFPGIENEYQITKEFLPDITLDEVNQLAFYFVKDKNMVVLITAPEKEDLQVPTEEEVLETILAARNKPLEAYVEEAVGEELITTPLPGGKVVEKQVDETFGTTTVKLDNGIEVVLKPTDFKNDEILMTSFAPGGTSVASDEDFLSAYFASQIINNSGLGEFDKIALRKFLQGKELQVYSQIGELSQSIVGNSVNKDLETLFQLAYLYFTQPRKDSTAFEAFISKKENEFKFMLESPQMVFYDTLTKLAYPNNPRKIVIPRPEQIQQIQLDKAFDFYKNAYADAGNFKFVFVGSFDVDSILPLITKYLGSLPAGEGNSQWVDLSTPFPEGITDATVYKGTEPQSMVAILMKGDFQWNLKNRVQSGMLMKILSIRLRESMREDQSGVYGVRSYQQIDRYPKPEQSVFVSWGCSPDNVEQLSNTVFREMKFLAEQGPGEENMAKARETYLRDLETSIKENRYWMNKIKDALWFQSGLAPIDEIQNIVNSTTPEELKSAAQQYFTPDHYLRVVLKPETDK